MYALGIDIGSSSVKVSLFAQDSGSTLASASKPDSEMSIDSPHSDWAEQSPQQWWMQTLEAFDEIRKRFADELGKVAAIGITYQMHGLVAVDEHHEPVRPSIIWCDSRATGIGEQAFRELGRPYCMHHYLNSPGNFTAAKLRWVQQHEPETYARIHKVMLPGDYIALRLSGEISTTETGLSEGIMWDYQQNEVASKLLDHWDIDSALLPDIAPAFDVQCRVQAVIADRIGIPAGTPVTYRAGDQPNNAFSLNVLHPGEVATTAGTSGVVYGVMDTPAYDSKSRVNTFLHPNHTKEMPRLGVLMCLNGTGILNRWLKEQVGGGLSYEAMNKRAAEVPAGADGVQIFPFGNGAERILANQNPGALFRGLSFNRHGLNHMLRASQEGIVFALMYGMEIMMEMGLKLDTIRAGRANMFLSPLFREIFVNTTGARLQLYDTDGAAGAARGALVGSGNYADFEQAFNGLRILGEQQPETAKAEQYGELYQAWKAELQRSIITEK